MATRSLIGINLDNGITKIIYCHWEPQTAIKILINFKNDKANGIIARLRRSRS